MKTKHLIREAFRTEVFARDKHRCKVCGKKAPLDAHHITNRDEIYFGGYVKSNGISLCPNCHVKAEEFHVSFGNRWYEGYKPEQLYVLISSSYNRACQDSVRELTQ